MTSINLFPVLDDEDEQDRGYKNGHNEQKEDELIVFGYSCKLFRDDFSAKAIDRGQSLIPWNGDENVMIDRYDCRGHLFDLAPWDSDTLQKQFKLGHHSMSETERRIEEECERERYVDLHKDLEKEALYKEEENKRQNMDKSSYSQVGFTYDDDSNKSKESHSKLIDETTQPLDDDEYEPFYPPEKLRIPYGMDIPESIKLNTIIEKTASFVSDSGLQMEIVLKTKQANNPQFDFLKYDHYLNPYYRHLISMIKSGKYRPNIDGHSNVKTEKEKSIRNGVDQNNVHDDEDDAGDSYLHPLLRGGSSNESNQTSKKIEEPVKILPVAMNIHDTAYGVLIKKYEHLRHREKVVKENEDSKLSTASDDNKNEESSPRSESSSLSHTVIPPPPDVKPIIDKLAEYVARNGAAFEQSIKTKNDPRFAFLERDHIHHNYYQLKLQICSQEIQKKELEEAQQRINNNNNDDERTVPAENVKLTLKSMHDDSQRPNTNPVFQSDEDSNSMPQDLNEPDESEEFIGPRPPSPEFLEKIRKQEERRGRLNDFVREKIARDKQEERKRKAELLVQKLKTQNNEIVGSTSSVSNENPTVNPVLVEKLLNVKNERPSSSLVTSPKPAGRSRNSRSSSKSRKYHRRSRSRSDIHRRSRRSSHKRSRTRSRSRSRHRSKRSKNSKSSRYSRDRRQRRAHHRHHRDSTSGSSSSRMRSSRSSSEASSSSSTSSSNERKKKKKIDDETKRQQQNPSRSNPQSKKWDQREPIKIKRGASNSESTMASSTNNKTTPSNSAAS